MHESHAKALNDLRELPQVDRLSRSLESPMPHAMKVAAARAAIQEAKDSIGSDLPIPGWEVLKARAEEILTSLGQHRLRALINATGVLLHTNLGRAPLSENSLKAVQEVASGYSNLEYNTETGKRGSRYDHAVDLLCRLTGAESALVVNNNAAAVLLSLSGTSSNREVIVSRGELVEIGGGFRIPEIMAQSSALMREVGTTNRTRLADYARAINQDTASIMKVHPSNYRIEGFAASVTSADLASLSRERGLSFIHDVGSGLLRRTIAGEQPRWLSDEPTVVDAVKEGADLITFSGDKLLGGPQAGLIVGKADVIKKLHRSALLRAFRIDKMNLAALEATLLTYLNNEEASLPLWRMALIPVEDLERRADTIQAAIKASSRDIEVRASTSTLGGGSAPESEIASVALTVRPANGSVEDLRLKLLSGVPPVVARITEDRLSLDLRTVEPRRDQELIDALSRVL